MGKVQLNLKIDAAVAARLREEAAAEGVTLAALAERRFLAPLPPAPEPIAGEIADGIAERMAALEARVAALEQARPRRRDAAPRGGGELLAPIPPAGDQERLGTPALAQLLGVGTSALNNWAAVHPPGSVRDGWRLVGRQRSPVGGPARLIWERATS